MKYLKRLFSLSLVATMLLFAACGSTPPTTTNATVPEAVKDAKPEEESADSADAEYGEVVVNQATTEIPAGESISQEQDIVAAMHSDLSTLDPMDTPDTLSGGIQRLILDGLYGFDDDMNLVPMLATGYEVNDSATEYVLTLRQGISFTDGTPWNADAAIANIAKWADESLQLRRTSFLSDVLGSWEALDEYTVKITLKKPFGAFASSLAHPATIIMSPKQIEAGVEVAGSNPVGTGQYTFVEWIPGDHLTIALNKDWWGYKPEFFEDGKPFVEADAGFKSITFKPVSESTTRTAMIQSGEAQIIWNVPGANVVALQEDPTISVGIRKSLEAYYWFLNNTKAPLDDKRVRQAINYAIDKDAYKQVVGNGIGELPTSVVGPVQFAKTEPIYQYDPEKSKALLAEAGLADGFSFSILTSTSDLKIAEFFKQQLEVVGIDLELDIQDGGAIDDIIWGGDGQNLLESVSSSWSASTADADWALRPVFASELAPPEGFNLSFYNNPEFDQLLQDALDTADPDTRREIYAKAQDILWEDSPVVVTSLGNSTWATSGKIINVLLYPDDAINFRAARMSK
ncbi:ABC transporter substrate-binding protein [Lachnospiraceae bacterium ZAX-1]